MRTAPTPPEAPAAGDVATLVNALRSASDYVGKTVVVKVGGSVARDGTALEDVAILHRLGLRTIVVHGGGPIISEWQRRMGLETKFVEGRRYTDELTLDLAHMVLIGKVNRDLVARLNKLGVKAVGLSGIDAAMFSARIRDPDLGLVGDVERVDRAALDALVAAGFVVVVAPAAVGPEGQPLNVNADSIAGDLARAIGASKCIFFTDVPGVKDGTGTVLPSMTVGRVQHMIASGEISGGMIPKVEACTRALGTGTRAQILDGRTPHALLLALFAEATIGTTISQGTA